MSEFSYEAIEALRQRLHAATDSIINDIIRELLQNPPTVEEQAHLIKGDIEALNTKLDAWVASGREDLQRVGVEIHVKLRRLKKDLGALDQANPIVQDATSALKTLLGRVLQEVFDVNPEAEAS